MEQPQENGGPSGLAMACFNTVLSIWGGFLSFISIGDVQAIGGLIATGVAIISGGFAIKYWRYAIKEKKQTIELNKIKQDENIH